MRTFVIATVSLLVGTVFASVIAVAWTGPTALAPGNNVAAPINVGVVDQIKDAGIGMNSLAVFGNAILNGVSRYLNFGPTVGEPGYGFRDNAGVMEFKNDGGSWQSFQAFVCALVDCGGGGGGGGGGSFWAASGDNIYNTNTANVGIGTTNPAAKLEVSGQVKITGGSPGAGRVLTSNATGLASWQTSIGPITQITFSDNTTQTTAPGGGGASCAAETKTLTTMSIGCYGAASEGASPGWNCPALAHGQTGRCTQPGSGYSSPWVICQNGTHQQTAFGYYNSGGPGGCDYGF